MKPETPYLILRFMALAIVTGSAGLIGSETCRRFHQEGLDILGIDNDLRAYFFGQQASTTPKRKQLESALPHYKHYDIDIRDRELVDDLFQSYGRDISVIVHAAGQPSHDWAVREPHTDFGVNAAGTLNLLEAARTHCPSAPFIFTSTNKVYGDTPNLLPYHEMDKRWEIDVKHRYHQHGIDESMSIDQTKHSLFGASKTAADLLVQEYGRYFDMKTVCFRCGCLTGPGHAGAELHGFLSYLIKCMVRGLPYRILGYKGKQVRDNIHSHDLVDAFWRFFLNPRSAAVYNIGGGRHANTSILEAIEIGTELSGKELNWTYMEENRIGDHIWWISDVRKFQGDYPEWRYKYDLREMLKEIIQALTD